MKIDSQKLYKDLEAKNLKPVYFLHGDEPYLLNGCVDSFKTAVLSEATIDFNYQLFYAGDADVTIIKDAVETLPVRTPISPSNARLCSPRRGARVRIEPGVPLSRGTTWCIGNAPMSASG